MFDFDAGKLLIIGVIALIVIGPKELPRVLRQVGQSVGKLRRMAAEFQGQFMDAMKEADIQSIKDEVEKISRESALDAHFDPARDIQAELTRSIERPAPDGPAAPVPGLAAPTADFTIPALATADTGSAGFDISTAGLADAGAAPFVADMRAIEEGEHRPAAVDEAEHRPAAVDEAEHRPAAVEPIHATAGAEAVHDRVTAADGTADIRSMSRKRKIMLPKRRMPRARAPHSVCDRTRVGPARLRLKAFEP